MARIITLTILVLLHLVSLSGFTGALAVPPQLQQYARVQAGRSTPNGNQAQVIIQRLVLTQFNPCARFTPLADVYTTVLYNTTQTQDQTCHVAYYQKPRCQGDGTESRAGLHIRTYEYPGEKNYYQSVGFACS